MKIAKYFRVVGFALLSGLVASASIAKDVTYSSQGGSVFRFTMPDSWQLDEGFEVAPQEMPDGAPPAPRIISLHPPGEEAIMWVGLWSPDQVRSLRDVPDYLKDLVPRLLVEPENLYADNRTIGGKPARLYSGIGYRKGRYFDYAIGVVQVSPGQLAIVAFVGEPQVFDKYEKALGSLFKSVRAGGAN